MTDRELLELAAKAAGLKYWIRSDGMGGGICLGENNPYGNNECQLWNPLTDDGDALRLAVKLGLTSIIDSEYFFETEIDGMDIREPHGLDPYSATRRAIVRASAEIGRAL
jgi:hypothetical protein